MAKKLLKSKISKGFEKSKTFQNKKRSIKKSKKAPKKSNSKKGMFNKFFKGVKIEVSEVKEKTKEKEEDVFEKLGNITEKVLKIKPSTQISKVLENYDKTNITIGVLGGHSALDVCRGAKKLGFRTVAVCQKGREQTYAKYYKTREGGKGIIDEIILVNKFKDIVKKEVQDRLRELNTIFIHNRYLGIL